MMTLHRAGCTAAGWPSLVASSDPISTKLDPPSAHLERWECLTPAAFPPPHVTSNLASRLEIAEDRLGESSAKRLKHIRFVKPAPSTGFRGIRGGLATSKAVPQRNSRRKTLLRAEIHSLRRLAGVTLSAAEGNLARNTSAPFSQRRVI